MTRVARRRAMAIDTEIPTTVLVSKVLDRFGEAFGQGARPVDLDGWVRRTLREVVALCESENVGPGLTGDNGALAALLNQLSLPVRSPALAKRRKTLLRRVAEVIGGREGRVVLALAGTESADQLAAQLHRAGVDVVCLQDTGLSRLREHLDRHPEFRRQLTAAGRQPNQARTAPLTDADTPIS
ncbi:hypothetical protein [Microlunatus phosphovorus]|nr:hypothetical protein [Microlunatus phosphovorus]